MKRLIVAVAIALSTAPAVAGAPFEQTELDRALPSIGSERVLVAQMGGTSYKSDEGNGSVWATDHNFIAPAQ